jgi:hypothetical protein
MKTGTFLDLDMRELGTRLEQGWRWWSGELTAMVPARMRSDPGRLRGRVARWREDGALQLDDEDALLPPNEEGTALRPATITVPASLCLTRTVDLPALGRADLRKLVALDLDRLMPFQPETAYADVLPDGTENGRTAAQVCALPKEIAQQVHADALRAGLLPTALGVLDARGTSLAFDFLPALETDGSVPQKQSARGVWWGIVALFFAVNLGLLIYRDMQGVAHLRDLVAAQQPSALAARKLATRIAREESLRTQILGRRETSNPLAMLSFTTRAMPTGSWVQRYSWSGDLLRLAGYKQGDTDVLGALRKTGRFATIRASTSDVAAESATGQPFDVTAETGAGAK